jgi:1-acyl-sn-glycerol-3-phosphate acyltransferase
MNDRGGHSLHEMASNIGENAPLISLKVFSSGLSFLVFGLVGLILSLTIFPFFYFLPIGAQRRKRWSRALLNRVFPAYIGFMELCGVIKLNWQGCENLRAEGQLIVANHPSLLDVVYLMAVVRNANCLVKPSLFYNPFTAGAVRAAGYIRNNSETLMRECAESLAAGETLIVFPEGTRTDPAKPFCFLRGAANIALEASSDLCPVTIRCQPARLMKHQAWYEMSKSTMQVSLEEHPSFSVAPYLESGLPRSRLSRQLTRDLEAFFASQ